MQNSKAISPEIKGLFDTVKNQAQEYADAFNSIDVSISVLERERNEMKKASKDLRMQVEANIESLQKTVSEIMDSVNEKAENAVAVINDLDQIKELSNRLEELHENLQSKEKVINIIINESNKILTDKIDNMIANAMKEINDHIKREKENLETKILLRQKQLDSRIVNFEKKILNIADHNKKDYGTLLNEVDDFKQVVTKSVTSDLMEIKNQNENNGVSKERILFEKNISAKVDDIHQKHLTLKDMFEEWSILNNFDIKELEKITQIRNKLKDLEEENQKFAKKANYSFLAASLSFILLIILIFTIL